MEENAIPPKSEWNQMSIDLLYRVKGQMTQTYYNMRASNASFANQYLKFISELDALISLRESEKEQQD